MHLACQIAIKAQKAPRLGDPTGPNDSLLLGLD